MNSEPAGAPATPPGRDRIAGLALCGGTVVTSLDPVRLVIADVVISGGRISRVGAAPPGEIGRAHV